MRAFERTCSGTRSACSRRRWFERKRQVAFPGARWSEEVHDLVVVYAGRCARRRPSFWRAECIGMGALDLALGLGTIRAAGARLEAVVPRKVEKSAVIDHEPVRVLPIFMRP
jgi:hypothetical protein